MCIKIDSATGYCKKKMMKNIWFLIQEIWTVWSEIRSEIKRINDGNKVFYEKNYRKNGIITDNDLPLEELW